MKIEQAENIVDKMYQDKFKETEKITKEGLEIDLSKEVEFTEFEEASVILLREELSLKKKLKNSISKDKIRDKIEEFKKNGYSMLLMKYGDRHILNLHLERALENLLKAYKQDEEVIDEMAYVMSKTIRISGVRQHKKFFKEYFRKKVGEIK